MENNYLTASEDKERKDAQALLNLIEKGLLTVSDEKKQELENIVAAQNLLDSYKDAYLADACQNVSSPECGAARTDLNAAYKTYFEKLSPEDYQAYNDAYATYAKYYDGYKSIESLQYGLDVMKVEADREALANRLSKEWNIDKATADKFILEMRITHDLAGLVAMVVGPKVIKPDFSVDLKGITTKQLNKKFKHAEDFGITTTKKNSETVAQFEAAIKNHMGNISTTQKGTYGFVEGSKVYFNSSTKNVVVLDKSGNFVTGFNIKPGTPQYDNYQKNGVLR